jgi:RNA recognition motif-containing protein
MRTGVRRQTFAVIIGGLPFECAEVDILKLLQSCGKITAVTINRNTANMSYQKPITVTATVEFQIREQADYAVHFIESSTFWGKRLR